MSPKSSVGPVKKIAKTTSRLAPDKTKISKVTKAHAEVILNVRKSFEEEKERGRISHSFSKVVKRTCEATGFSKKIVNKITTAENLKDFDVFSKITRERGTNVPPDYRCIIRQVMRDHIIIKKRLPTLDSILKTLKEKDYECDARNNLENTPWIWSKETLRTFMISNGFIHGARRSHYDFTKERGEVVSMREDYLKWIQTYRQGGYSIFYQDETWVCKNIAVKKLWQTKAIKEATEIHYRVPSGKGPRLIVSHVASSATGLLDNCLLIFKGEKNPSADYHTEMNSEVFFEWLRSIVFPEMKRKGRKSVLVLDRATYHTKLTEHSRPPSSSWRKRDLICAIKRWGGRVPSSWPIMWWKTKTNVQLLRVAKKLAPPPKYMAQEIADSFAEGDFCIKILFLPVAHPELNPIEMVWGQVKRAVSTTNLDFNMRNVWRLTEHEMRKIDAETFTRYETHCLREENRYRLLGNMIDAGSYDGSDYVLSVSDDDSSYDDESAEDVEDSVLRDVSWNSSISDSD